MNAFVTVDDLGQKCDGFFFFQFSLCVELVSECAIGAEFCDDVHAIFSLQCSFQLQDIVLAFQNLQGFNLCFCEFDLFFGVVDQL